MVDPLDNLASSEQLRRLLLHEEQERIDRLEARYGDEDALKSSLIPVIADVLRDAGVKDYRSLAGALAPVVLQSIKTEIHNSRDMMVDALYPITGRLVAAAVRNAFKDLVDQLNSRLDSTLSIDRWRAKFKAKISGRSEAEILLSEGAAFEIISLLLINRHSGLLIAQAGSEDEQGETDSQLLGGILTAIMAFVRDAMNQSSEQDLRTLHVGDVSLHLQVSPGAILAVKTNGPPPAGFETALNETFYAILSQWGRVLSDPDQIGSRDEIAITADLEERFQSLLEAKSSNFKSSLNKGAFLLGMLALSAVLWIGWTGYQGWLTSDIEAKARLLAAASDELKGYPIDMSYDQDDNMLTVSGLFPNPEEVQSLHDELKQTFPEIGLSMAVGHLPDQSSIQQDMATKSDLGHWQQRLSGEFSDILDDRMSTLSDEISGIKQRLPTSSEAELEALSLWIDRQSIRFDEETDYHDEARAKDLLVALADRVSNLSQDIGLRIIGYGDDLGEEQLSKRLSQLRARLVSEELQRLGISERRLQAIGRGEEGRISSTDGPGSANRRVEFELIYPSDQAPRDDGR